jgi:hypothetical protein
MNLAALLVELRNLARDPARNWARITSLVATHKGLAEFEVARHYVAELLAPQVAAFSRSEDPRLRKAAARIVKHAMPPGAGVDTLRRLAKDPDPGARAIARAAAVRLGVTDVALPDPRTRPHALADMYTYGWADAAGPWNFYGWRFGAGHGKSSRAIATARRRAQLPDAAVRGALPKLAGAMDVAALVGAPDLLALQRFARPGECAGAGYVRFTIPKSDGGQRVITAPRAALKRAQRALLAKVLERLPTHPCAHGFVKGRSVLTNATPHVGRAVVVKLDLDSFFPTVDFRRVEGMFRYYGYAGEAARALALLCTHRPVLPDGYVVWPGVLPQGAPTSPAVANLVCRRLDARLEGVARRFGATYTRYADDLTFSFADAPKALGRFLWWVDQVTQQEGFALNARKKKVLRRNQQQRVTGVVVNDRPSVPRADRRRLRAILHQCRNEGLAAAARGRDDFATWLRGEVAWVHAVQPELGARLRAEVEALLAKPAQA